MFGKNRTRILKLIVIDTINVIDLLIFIFISTDSTQATRAGTKETSIIV